MPKLMKRAFFRLCGSRSAKSLSMLQNVLIVTIFVCILAVPAQAANFCGKMVMPAGTLGSISRGFTSYHSGIDLAAPFGSTIRAAAGGIVIYAGWYNGYGKAVDIRHDDGLITRYAHMSAFAPDLGVGIAVKAGQIVGLVGRTGHATGNHIHFEVRYNGYAVDPAPFIGVGRCVMQPPETPVEEAFAPARPR